MTVFLAVSNAINTDPLITQLTLDAVKDIMPELPQTVGNQCGLTTRIPVLIHLNLKIDQLKIENARILILLTQFIKENGGSVYKKHTFL
jgi:hypothetical protein